MKSNSLTILAFAAALVAAPAFAAPKVSVAMKAEKDIVVVENGKQVKKRVEAKNQVSGEVIFYTISYRNEGTEVARDIRIDNKVPEATTYVADSAKGNAEITFSGDNGKSYAKAGQVTREVTDAKGKKQSVAVQPEQYTDIRWTVPQIAAGATGDVGYAVRVK